MIQREQVVAGIERRGGMIAVPKMNTIVARHPASSGASSNTLAFAARTLNVPSVWRRNRTLLRTLRRNEWHSGAAEIDRRRVISGATGHLPTLACAAMDSIAEEQYEAAYDLRGKVVLITGAADGIGAARVSCMHVERG